MSDFESSVETVSELPGRAREGLPSTYRMRAEGHYVDLLGSRTSGRPEKVLSVHALSVPDSVEEPSPSLVESIRRYGVLQPLLVQEHDEELRIIAGHKRLLAARRAGLRDVPCVVYDVSDDKAARLSEAASIVSRPSSAPPAAIAPTVASFDQALHAGRELSQSLATLSACIDVLATSPSALSRAALANLAQAEAWRASTVLRATRIIRNEWNKATAPVQPSNVVHTVIEGFQPERRVRGITIDVRSDLSPAATLAGDERMIESAVASALLATLALLDGIENPRVTLAIAPQSPSAINVTISQQMIAAPASWAARAFDPAWIVRPGGSVAAIAMLTIERVASAHGGLASATCTTHGTSITLRLPAGA